MIKPADIIRKYYSAHPEAWQILLEHSRKVTQRALKVARYRQQFEQVDLQFIAEAAMLHDIGMMCTYAPSLHCSGSEAYITHGIKGRDILEQEGLPRHALVCERHTGVGLSAVEIEEQKLPLPRRDMLPLSIEEQIICYADLFYSKNPQDRHKEKTPKKVRKSLNRYGPGKVATFNRWLDLFEPELIE